MTDFAPVPPPGELDETCASFFYFGLFGPLCENMTSFKTPEVHNILHCRLRRTEPRPQVTCTESFVFFWAVLADRQQTNTLIAIRRTSSEDKVNIMTLLQTFVPITDTKGGLLAVLVTLTTRRDGMFFYFIVWNVICLFSPQAIYFACVNFFLYF